MPVQTVTVAPDEADQRLDRWFRRRFPHIGQGRIEKMCRKGEIRVDGSRAKASARLAEGMAIRIPPLPDAGEPPRTSARQEISDADRDLIRNAVIHRDDDIIVLNKPPGLPTQGGSGQTRHIDGMAEALRFGLDEKPRLVHRLDRDHQRRSGAGAHPSQRASIGRSDAQARNAEDILGGRCRRARAQPRRNSLWPGQGCGTRAWWRGRKNALRGPC